MPKVYKDGQYITMTEEDYAEQYPQPETPPSEPTDAERIAALEAAVADLALQNLPVGVKTDA